MGEIIQLNAKATDEIRESLKIKQAHHCSHKYVEVDIDERELRCQTCKSVVEPFDFILSMAYEERNQQWTQKELKRQIESLKDEKQRLEKDVNNLKAQKRRIS
jgi:hypothetical protein